MHFASLCFPHCGSSMFERKEDRKREREGEMGIGKRKEGISDKCDK